MKVAFMIQARVTFFNILKQKRIVKTIGTNSRYTVKMWQPQVNASEGKYTGKIFCSYGLPAVSGVNYTRISLSQYYNVVKDI